MLPERLRELRTSKEFNYSQYELGKKVGFSTQAVSKWEQGTAEPNYETLIMLSEIFNVCIDYLLGKTDVKKYNINYFTKTITDEDGYSIEIKTEVPFNELPKEKQQDMIDTAMEKLFEVKKEIKENKK